MGAVESVSFTIMRIAAFSLPYKTGSSRNRVGE
jgi:hypothetical protein